MTDTPDLELRKRMAERLGWTELSETPTGWIGTHPTTLMFEDVPTYELSLDACFRDVVPWARAKGYRFRVQGPFDATDGLTWAGFTQMGCSGWNGKDDFEAISDKPNALEAAATATCLAFLKLP